jgi:hypothetical protein
MKDTTPEMEAEYERRLMSLKPEERLAMACRMFSAAKALALASIPKDETLSPGEIKAFLFLRFYGEDFGEEDRQRIVAQLKGTVQPER